MSSLVPPCTSPHAPLTTSPECALPPDHPASKAARVLGRPDLARPVLARCPFPEAITAGSAERAGAFAALAAGSLTAIEEQLALIARRRARRGVGGRGAPPERGAAVEGWERTPLAHQLGLWRAFEAFRLLHVRGWCPALLFRLQTGTDLAVLLDPRVDSSRDGYGARQKRVLAKRGIADRHRWAEARRRVASMGLLSDGAPTSKAALAPSSPAKAPAADTSRAADASPKTPAEATGQEKTTRSEKVRPSETGKQASRYGGIGAPTGAPEENGPPDKQGSAGDADGGRVGAEAGTGAGTGALPAPRRSPAYDRLPSLTKAQIEAVYHRHACGPWSLAERARLVEAARPSQRKTVMIRLTGQLLRYQAGLEAAHLLSAAQLEELACWMRARWGAGSPALAPARGRRLGEAFRADLHVGRRLYGDFEAAARLAASGRGLSPEAWGRYRDGELRRLGAFAYGAFYEERRAAGEGRAEDSAGGAAQDLPTAELRDDEPAPEGDPPPAKRLVRLPARDENEALAAWARTGGHVEVRRGRGRTAWRYLGPDGRLLLGKVVRVRPFGEGRFYVSGFLVADRTLLPARASSEPDSRSG